MTKYELEAEREHLRDLLKLPGYSVRDREQMRSRIKEIDGILEATNTGKRCNVKKQIATFLTGVLFEQGKFDWKGMFMLTAGVLSSLYLIIAAAILMFYVLTCTWWYLLLTVLVSTNKYVLAAVDMVPNGVKWLISKLEDEDACGN